MCDGENASCCSTTSQLQGRIDQSLVEHTAIQEIRCSDTKRDSRVQRSTRDATNSEATHGHTGTNGKTKHMRGLGTFGDCHAKNDEAKYKGVHDLGHRDTCPSAESHRSQTKSGTLVDEGISQCCSDASSNLDGCIGASLGRSQLRATARSEDRHCNCRVEMRSGDIARGINHRSEASSNRECSSLGFAQHIQTNGEDQHVSAQEFTDQFSDLRLLSTEIFWTYHFEECCGQGSTKQLENNVNKAPTKTQARTGKINAQGNCRVETTTRHSTSPISTCHHSECNRHSIVLVLLSCILLGRGNIHHHKC
mmetsp:Transcript_117914/g.165766  ORF Transcript_117914/g.165766 Transcript_117914/m.165766 type:complete len:308 (+) Transcript_117914:174-1097(+)